MWSEEKGTEQAALIGGENHKNQALEKQKVLQGNQRRIIFFFILKKGKRSVKCTNRMKGLLERKL
jgi:hypothetical protein